MASTPSSSPPSLPDQSMRLSAFIYEDEGVVLDALLAHLSWDDRRAARVRDSAATLVARMRTGRRKVGQLETFLRQYGLETEEGLALMTLAEALLRIPDAATADALIRDKMVAAEWLSTQAENSDVLVKAAGFGLSLTRKALDSAFSKLGEPLIRKAMVEAIRVLGRQFVLGRTIEEAQKNARDYHKKGYSLSYDMLGEGARTAAQAQGYFESYRDALAAIGASSDRHVSGLSVKLSALYPRYEYKQAADAVPVLAARVKELAFLAAERNVALTLDAEEADRLMLSLDILDKVMAEPALRSWDGLGLAVQAYQKRALPLIDHLADLSATHKRRLQVRLVKGAYWDTEIKRAQVLGLPDYPVFTRKAHTDVSFLTCAQALLARRDVFYPMLATHNAHTVAAVLDMAGDGQANVRSGEGFEFQRLHGMGESLYDLILQEEGARVRVYAPCGTHEDLLPYLVRRLLENGANSSFVHKLLDPETPIEFLVADPVADTRAHPARRHPRIPLPSALYGPDRVNAAGLDLTQAETVAGIQEALAASRQTAYEAAPLLDGQRRAGTERTILNPALCAGADADVVGRVLEADQALVPEAFTVAAAGFEVWRGTPVAARADCLLRLADLLEADTPGLMALSVREAGKTYDDALAEVREAVDFCRYYAQQGRRDLEATLLPGPTGERNTIALHGRGVFVCISPWNFPLAIFTGQVTAALMAGNAVIAKPAEQTPLIAARVVALMVAAGIPAAAITLLPGDGDLGAALVAHDAVAGVAFTGSTTVARAINRALAAKDGPIVPLIAETGGQNAMIVDSSALLEQVVDDVLVSAFGAAGQRCSALRVLYVQEDIADKLLTMLKGAMAVRRVGDPADISHDIGPVIDAEALRRLEIHKDWLDEEARFIAAVPLPPDVKEAGTYFAPVAYEIHSIRDLHEEVFGPVLHVVRYRAADIDRVIADINATGYGLTFGVHSRVGSTMTRLTRDVQAGNAYVNRTMVGAVVGVQPFGGHGLSGTGPKAGGPHYLPRFATEYVVSVDTTRQGGNASLVSLRE